MYKVAVIDDDEYWCFAIQRFLRKEFDVSIFTDTHSFLRSQIRHDLAIVDFTILPPSEVDSVMNGCELVRHLKMTRPSPPLVILTSGFIDRNDFAEGANLCAEADAFLSKDAGLDALLEQIRQLLEQSAVSNLHG